MPQLCRPVAVGTMVMGFWWCVVSVAAAQNATPPGQNAQPPAEKKTNAAPPAAAAPGGKQITMNFEDVDLGVLVKFISEITQKNFIVDDKVKGKVTVISPEKISVDEAYLVFQSVLQVKGFTTVPSGAVIKIVPSKEARTSTLPTVLPPERAGTSDEFITRLIPLQHVDANNMVAILQPMVSPDGLLASYEATNSLILIDTAGNSARLVRILSELDVEGHERGIDVIRLNYAFATEIATTLAQVLEEDDTSGTAPQPGVAPRATRALRPRPGQVAAPGQAAVVAGGTPGNAFKIIPDERTNTLIVLAGPLEMRRIKDLVVRLDVPLPIGTGRIHVYYLKYANAVEMVAILSDLIGGGQGGIGGIGRGLTALGVSRSASFRGGGLGGSSFNRGNIGGALGGGFGGSALGGFAAGSALGGGFSGSRLGGSSGFGGGTLSATQGLGGAGGLGGTGPASAEGEGIRITADPSTNSLIINSAPQDYETLKEVIEKLDVRRRQVYIEAIILEVRFDKSRALGFDYQGGTGFNNGVGLGRLNLTGNLNPLLSNPAGISGLLLAAASNQTVRLPDGSTVPAQVALFTALQNDSDVNILSAPNLLTTDNQEAEIVVGQNIPFVSSRSTSETNLSNQFNTIERRDVGITLRITPQISEGGTVRLNLFEEVSAVVPSASDAQAIALGPTTTIRSATTTVVARENQTVVVGGLIADDITNSRSQIPFIGDIPVIGNLVRSTTTSRQKINLLMFLTPHIVRNEMDQRRLSLEQRDRLKAFMSEQHIPEKRADTLNMPSWESLPPPAEGGEKDQQDQSNDHRGPGALEDEPLSTAPQIPRYVLLATFWEQGQPPPSLATQSGLVPLSLPPDSQLSALFASGKTVRFESDTYSALFRCLDTFSNAEQARAVYPEGLRVSSEPHELLHWRELQDASSRNVRSWTPVD